MDRMEQLKKLKETQKAVQCFEYIANFVACIAFGVLLLFTINKVAAEGEVSHWIGVLIILGLVVYAKIAGEIIFYASDWYTERVWRRILN